MAQINVKISKQVENLKVLCAKLTEQFKKHLLNHEAMKKDMYNRFGALEAQFPIIKNEIKAEIFN